MKFNISRLIEDLVYMKKMYGDLPFTIDDGRYVKSTETTISEGQVNTSETILFDGRISVTGIHSYGKNEIDSNFG